MKKIIFIVASLALCHAFAKEVKIGVIMPLSGSVAAYGQSALEGIKTAHSMKNTLENGDKVELVVLDSRGDKIESATAATRLVAQDKVLGLIGEMLTANTLQAMRVAEDKKVPIIAPAATSDKLLNNKFYSSRVCFMDSFQGSSLAKYAFDELKFKEAVVVMDAGTDYSLGLARAFEKEFTQKGGKILGKIKVSSTSKDYKAAITQIQALKAEFVYMPLYYSEAALFVRQARNLGLKASFASADGVADSTFIDLAKNASEGYLYTDSFDYEHPPTELSKQFISLFQEQNKANEVPNFAAMGADAYLVMFEAMNACKADLTSACINDKIHSTKDFKGVSGIINIDKSGNATRSLVLKQISNQKASYKATINP